MKTKPKENMMTTYKTKLQPGDTAYRVSLTSRTEKVKCALCSGRGHVPIGDTSRTVRCPDCHYGSNTVTSPEFYEVEVDQVGQTRITDTRGNVEVSYMLESTGVGSGSVHPEKNIFATRKDAESDAATRNKGLNK